MGGKTVAVGVDLAGTTVGFVAGDAVQAVNRKKNTINFNIFCMGTPPLNFNDKGNGFAEINLNAAHLVKIFHEQISNRLQVIRQ
jgi:hypothetical protein